MCRSDAQINFILIAIRADEAHHESTTVVSHWHTNTRANFVMTTNNLRMCECLFMRGLCDWTWTQCNRGCDYTIWIFSARSPPLIKREMFEQCLRKRIDVWKWEYSVSIDSMIKCVRSQLTFSMIHPIGLKKKFYSMQFATKRLPRILLSQRNFKIFFFKLYVFFCVYFFVVFHFWMWIASISFFFLIIYLNR